MVWYQLRQGFLGYSMIGHEFAVASWLLGVFNSVPFSFHEIFAEKPSVSVFNCMLEFGRFFSCFQYNMNVSYYDMSAFGNIKNPGFGIQPAPAVQSSSISSLKYNMRAPPDTSVPPNQLTRFVQTVSNLKGKKSKFNFFKFYICIVK